MNQITKTTNLEIETTPNESILGPAAHYYYSEATPKNGSIYDNSVKGTIEFYPAGFTQLNPTGINRQDVYQKLFYWAQNWNANTLYYPLGKKNHNIKVLPESDNKFDPFAIRISLQIDKTAYPSLELPVNTWIDLGYVPAKISKYLQPNIHRIREGHILKIKNNMHGKYFGAKVILYYKPQGLSNTSIANIQRFQNIMEE